MRNGLEKGAVLGLVLLASVAATGTGCRRGPTPESQGLAARREAHFRAATAARDVCEGLHVRVEADEPLTPEFVELLCVWPRRLYLHELAAATSDSERAAALDDLRRAQRKSYDLLRGGISENPAGIQPHLLITEFYLRESELAVAGPDDTESPHRSLPETAGEVMVTFQKRIEADEPLTPEFVTEVCRASRRLCLVQTGSTSARAQWVRAAKEHAARVAQWLEFTRSKYTTGGPFPRHNLEYYLAEANLWAEQARSGGGPATLTFYSAMAAAARGHLDSIMARKKADEPLSLEFVDELCLWSRRHATAASTPDQHLRRMRDLHAELDRMLRQGGDVSRIQVSQAAYFVHDAEAGTPVGEED